MTSSMIALLCKARGQYLLTLQVHSYCIFTFIVQVDSLLALYGSAIFNNITTYIMNFKKVFLLNQYVN